MTYYSLFALTAVINFRSKHTVCIFLESALLQAFYLIHTTIKFEIAQKLLPNSNQAVERTQHIQSSVCNKKDECLLCSDMCSYCEDTSTVQTLLCPIWKRAWKMSLEIWCPGTVKSQPGWSDRPPYEALIFQYIKPTESCGNVPCSIRIIEGKVWGRKRERAVPLKGWSPSVVTVCGYLLWSQ